MLYILIYYTDSSGRSVSTVSAGGWSNAGCKTYRGFRVNINYYLRAGMNCGGVGVGRRYSDGGGGDIGGQAPGNQVPCIYTRSLQKKKKKNT